ncbi:insulin-like growth factor-binding protein 5 [Girardinichthys multiradiatus]|uniref:insulin-like growth factor-binding protein 5 n=1 Tax=Girardinichthys multiradiatus TaxID=208333 RepID=UPI001FACB12B|nr:insulin-like growth factor-binding protein 5 [Girardinichthys multiradiatus]
MKLLMEILPIKMFLHVNILMLLVQKVALSSIPTRPSGGCPTCTGESVDLHVASLSSGEPCGIYTLSCAPGLRCEPLKDELRPLHALLEGRGVCSNVSSTTPATHVYTVELAPTEDPNEAPCRKLLMKVIKSLDAHLFKSNHDVYMPNCDKSGFYKKKQCWSSRGKQRGKCWCVDENGVPVPPKTKRKRNVIC